MITLDTSAIYAVINRGDRHHAAVIAARDEDRGPYYVPSGILAEAAYMIETDLGLDPLERFLGDVDRGTYVLDCGERDMPRILQLVRKYADLRLGFADAAVIACAERHKGRTLTTDRRHFPVVARGEKTIVVLPD